MSHYSLTTLHYPHDDDGQTSIQVRWSVYLDPKASSAGPQGMSEAEARQAHVVVYDSLGGKTEREIDPETVPALTGLSWKQLELEALASAHDLRRDERAAQTN